MCEGLRVVDIQKQIAHSPFYLYSADQIRANFNAYHHALQGIPSEISFAVKANNNLHILKLIRELGSWVTLVSGNEIRLSVAAGFSPEEMIFNGNGKTIPELRYAIKLGTFINIDSLFDLNHIYQVSQELGVSANVLLRITPDVDPKVHPFIATGLKASKFGVSLEQIPAILDQTARMPSLNLLGIHCHLGSSITQIDVYKQAVDILVRQFNAIRVKGYPLEYFNIGGGLGIDYTQTQTGFPTPYDLVASIREKIPADATLIIEPGRSIIGNTGILVCRVLGVKSNDQKNFIVVDGSMTELIRPSLYQAYHKIDFIRPVPGETKVFDIVGPVCESSDYLGKDRRLPTPGEGAGIAVFDAGAYGMVMSSNYNTRTSPPEYLVNGDQFTQIRRAESYQDYIKLFNLPTK